MRVARWNPFADVLAVAIVAAVAHAAASGAIFEDDFSGFRGGQQNAAQVNTRLRLSYAGRLPAWDAVGQGSVHVVDRSGAGDFAAMIWVDNVLTLAEGVAANDAGRWYTVSFTAGPTVYALPAQATAATDGLVVDVVRHDRTVLASFVHRPGGWQGRQVFAAAAFDYEGDGSGPVRLRVRTLANSGRFGGAIEDVAIAAAANAEAKGRFKRDVAPLLAAHCLECHRGPGAEAGLDLASREGAFAGGDGGEPITPGDPDSSLLWLRVAADEMPPTHPLTPAQRQVIRDWIASGAEWGNPTIDPFEVTTEKRAGYDWWSLQPLRPVQPPDAAADEPLANPIDRFVRAELVRAGLAPSPPAPPRTLVRRASIDLTGLPPSPEAVDRFDRDPSDAAWAALVDDLLASDAYAERWARHWLDVVRFGESDGFEYNAPRDHAWHYRDWVIRALAADMPYDEFVRMQIAGDVLAPDSLDGGAATGMLVAGVHNGVVGADQVARTAARQDELEEMAGTVAQAFLGMTVNCSRCHDHKFDPVATDDYYRFVSALAGANHGTRNLRDAQGRDVPVYMATSGNPGATTTFVRGDAARPGVEVLPGGPKAVRGVASDFGLDRAASDAERRRKLAAWMTDPNNGPVLRVIVNRVWAAHFGRGIVDTPSDFGFNGGRPSHPELLEWLAGWFRDQGMSLKKLHRLIMTSATYRQASRMNPEAMRIDADNRLLWRMTPRRVEAEVLRDSILDVAGALDRTRFGPGYRDVEIMEVPPTHYYRPIDPEGAAFNRRTIYRWSPRGQRSALLDTFDCPDPSAQTPKRSVTTTPSQALSQWNDSFVLRMAHLLAERVAREAAAPADRRHAAEVERLWRLVFCRPPEPREQADAEAFAREHGLPLLCRVVLNANEFIVID